MVGDSVDRNNNSKKSEASQVIREAMKNQSELQSNAIKEENSLHNQGRGVTLFFSFDIVNSTDYKQKNVYQWPGKINSILELLRKNVNESLPGAAIWRILGDEIIFIISVKNHGVLPDMIHSINKVLSQTVEDIHSRDPQGNLSLKAVAWIAFISNNVNETDEKSKWYNYSLIYHVDIIHGRYISEFIGNDIDCGFRIRDYAVKGMFFLSFELAYLIMGKISESNNSTKEGPCGFLQVLGFKKLKGIWDNRPYPIISYSLSKNSDDLLKNITYDLFESNDIISEYKNNLYNNGVYPSYYFKNTNEILYKICRDMNLQDKIDFLIREMKSEKQFLASDLLRDDDLLQFHLVAVCCDVDKEKVLIAKRSTSRTILPGYWEFGCAKVQKDRTIEESIQEKYAKDFENLKVHIPKYTTRKESPIPYALFEVPSDRDAKDGKSDKGVIMMAKVDTSEGVNLNNDKHSEIRWIGRDGLDEFYQKETKLVPDFCDTIRAAFNFINTEKGKRNG